MINPEFSESGIEVRMSIKPISKTDFSILRKPPITEKKQSKYHKRIYPSYYK